MAKTVTVSAEIKKYFFDQQKVKQKLQKKEEKALARAGGYVRKVARSSIRFRKNKKSQPGRPPFYHVKGKTSWSIRTILFGYDPKNHSVIIGPVKFPTLGVVPEVLEDGASNHPFEFLDNNKETKVARGNYKPRPFMGPALKTSTDKVAEFFGEL